MTRYFFNIKDNNQLIADKEGLELAGIDAAMIEAKQYARDFAVECVRDGKAINGRKISVVDDDGKAVYEYGVRDVIATLAY